MPPSATAPTSRAAPSWRRLTQLDAAAARPLLEEALRDKEWALRVRAADLLEQAGVPAATPEAAIRPAVPGRAIDEAEWQGTGEPAVLAARVHRRPIAAASRSS